mgnify:CR=1 FL=1
MMSKLSIAQKQYILSQKKHRRTCLLYTSPSPRD